MTALHWLRSAFRRLCEFERVTRPLDRSRVPLLQAIWRDLPARNQVPEQTLGRLHPYFSLTHGIFPKCDFACTACYLPERSNSVKIDRAHVLAELERQMRFLDERNGEQGGTAQLIDGEVSLLGPELHAEAILLMQRHNRLPVSLTHGDFDYEYLRALVEHGKGEIRRLAFSGHFDTTMVGRRGIKRAARETDLNPYRERFLEMFRRLERETGVECTVTHNCTVTNENFDQIPGLVRDLVRMGFGMMSFQPVAQLGGKVDHLDRVARHGAVDEDGELLWRQIQNGLGIELGPDPLIEGDPRCNRGALCLVAGERVVPLLDVRHRLDRFVRDALLEAAERGFGAAMDCMHDPAMLRRTIVKALRLPFVAPRLLKLHLAALLFGAKLVSKAGPLRVLRHGVRFVFAYMHRYMDERDVREAMRLSTQGITASDPRILATQERLRSCSWRMAHPDRGELVPACAQQAVLAETEVGRLLEIQRRPRSAASSGGAECPS
jgi:hypothetical protein